MGVSTDALLVYGFDLGGGDAEWAIEGAESGLHLDWWDEDQEAS
jgi:hypothetical protein